MAEVVILEGRSDHSISSSQLCLLVVLVCSVVGVQIAVDHPVSRSGLKSSETCSKSSQAHSHSADGISRHVRTPRR